MASEYLGGNVTLTSAPTLRDGLCTLPESLERLPYESMRRPTFLAS
jgi:hypothetical protein